MTVYTLIEQVGLDIQSVRTLQSRDAVHRLFELCAKQNGAQPIDPSNWPRNTPDSLRSFAGDEEYSVAVYETPVTYSGNAP